MLKSTHYDEEHSLLVLQFDGVYVGAEAQRAGAAFIKTQKVLPRYFIFDYRTVTTADMLDSDNALLTYTFRSLPFPPEQVNAMRFVHLLPADSNHPLWERFHRNDWARSRFSNQRTLLAASDDPEHDWQQALSALDLPSTIAQPD